MNGSSPKSRGGRLGAQVLHRELRVLTTLELPRASLDEVAHERPVLVQDRSAARRVLLERERQVDVLGGEDVERAEAEAAQRAVQVWGADGGHGPSAYALGITFPAWHAGHQ